MRQARIQYDSSIFPIHNGRYGIPNSPCDPYIIYQTASHKLIEFPMSTVRLGKFSFPLGSSGYLRLYPRWLSAVLMRMRLNEGLSIILYAYPLEIDVNLPKIPVNFVVRSRHYTGIKISKGLDRIKDRYVFTSFLDSKLLSDLLNKQTINEIKDN